MGMREPLHGEIEVIAVMNERERQQTWCARQTRDGEWIALKQWWAAERAVRHAGNARQRRRAEAMRTRTARLYASALHRAWPKWQRVREELRARRADPSIR